ncbi:hypothetical protein CW304_20860 [Bacillus sp. UFRGS-B20]|nr:hypothetical protein CW304_20860 [Bacillus sp. UFRGS-B20]
MLFFQHFALQPIAFNSCIFDVFSVNGQPQTSRAEHSCVGPSKCAFLIMKKYVNAICVFFKRKFDILLARRIALYL